MSSAGMEGKARKSPSSWGLLWGSCDYVYKITSKICSATSVQPHTGIPWALQLLWLISPSTDKATLSFPHAVATALALSYNAVQLQFDVRKLFPGSCGIFLCRAKVLSTSNISRFSFFFCKQVLIGWWQKGQEESQQTHEEGHLHSINHPPYYHSLSRCY